MTRTALATNARRVRILAWLTFLSGLLPCLIYLLPFVTVAANEYDGLLAFGICVSVTALLLVSTLLARGGSSAPIGLAQWGLALAIIGGGGGILLVPKFSFLLYHADKMMSANHLRTVAIALVDYDAKVGHLPPAAIVDGEGKPLLSWRVALLPYLGMDELHKQFLLDEPWDSPHNLQLLPRIPEVYVPRPKGLCRQGETFVQAFTGPGTLFETGQVRSLADVKGADGLKNTILLVEAGEAVPWTQPVDVDVVANRPIPLLGGPARFARRGIVVRTGPRLSSSAHMVFGDLTVRGFLVPHEGDQLERIAKFERALRPLITWNGKEVGVDVEKAWEWDWD